MWKNKHKQNRYRIELKKEEEFSAERRYLKYIKVYKLLWRTRFKLKERSASSERNFFQEIYNGNFFWMIWAKCHNEYTFFVIRIEWKWNEVDWSGLTMVNGDGKLLMTNETLMWWPMLQRCCLTLQRCDSISTAWLVQM